MKILLLNPPPKNEKDNVHVDAVLSRHSGARVKTNYLLPPIGLMYIGAILRREGFNVSLLDSMAEKKRYEEILDKTNRYDIVICPIATSNCRDVYDFLKSLRVKYRIVTGTHASYFWKDILERGIAEIVITGEPEFSVLETVKAIASNGDFTDIRGISYIKDGKVVRNPDMPLIQDLDALPFPDRDLIKNSNYWTSFFPKDNFTILLTARGCPARCTFCTTHHYYNYTYRVRSAENVVEELKEIKRKYGIKSFGFWDDTFTIKKERTIKICELMIKERLSMKWTCLSRADTVDLETLRIMKKAGCMQIQYGVETGVQEILNNVRKGITIQKIEKTINEAKQVGIEQTLFFMIGNKGENKETVRKTVEFAKRLDPEYVSFNIATPFPGSALYEEIKDVEGLDMHKFDTLTAPISLCELSVEELNKSVKNAYREFYFRPKYIIKTFLRTMKRPNTFFPVLRAGYETARMVM
jgi:anaerobic magnesium-protoporphyrin IX monomethyl ester cyclase